MSATPVRYYQSVGRSSFAAVIHKSKQEGFVQNRRPKPQTNISQQVGRDKKKSSSESYFNGDIDYVYRVDF